MEPVPLAHRNDPVDIPLPDAQLTLFRQVDLGIDQGELLQQLISGIPWRSEDITVFGKTYQQPRLIAWYGDEDATYTYSGISHEPLAWCPPLDQLKRRVESLAESRFNSVLLNYYRDHRDSMGLHADDEPELGTEPVIAALSLGAERKLHFKHKTRRDLAPLNVALPSGSLLIMRGPTQRHWKHGLRKLRRPCGPRVNLTFRLVGHG